MTAARFRRHLELIEIGRYPVIPLHQAVEAIAGTRQLPPLSVAITIDDGWYSTYAEMWPELYRREMPATLYVDTATLLSEKPVPHVMARYLIAECGADLDEYGGALARATPKLGGLPLEGRLRAAAEIVEALDLDMDALHAARRFEYMTPNELRTCFSQGLDIQLHTRSHLLVERTAEEVEREVRLNREDLVGLLDAPPERFHHFCYPSGVHDPAMHAGLRRADVTSATTTVAGLADSSNDLHALPRLIISETHSDLEFEAELAGVMQLLRSLRDLLSLSQ
jgi:peptidoglycan/xylan/chitin deacetylase (PgdA/CDA1 family)